MQNRKLIRWIDQTKQTYKIVSSLLHAHIYTVEGRLYPNHISIKERILS